MTSLFISLGELNLGAEEQSGIGFSPVAFRGPRAALACREIAWGAAHGIRRFVCHTGPIPGEGLTLFVQTLVQLAEMCADFGAELLMESGQETAEATEKLLAEIDRPNVGINFDPANLVYYGNTAPAEFRARLQDRIRGLHCKDAVRPLPGAGHGEETPLGAGEVSRISCSIPSDSPFSSWSRRETRLRFLAVSRTTSTAAIRISAARRYTVVFTWLEICRSYQAALKSTATIPATRWAESKTGEYAL